MDEIIVRNQTLPETIEELVDFVLVGNEAIRAVKLKIKALSKVDIAKGVRDQKIREGREISKLVIDAESRLGELLENTQKQGLTKEYGSTGGTIPSLPSGLDKKQSHYAQEIYRHPEIVTQVFGEYETKEDIPTKHDILKRIKETKRKQKIDMQKEEIRKGLTKPSGLFDIIVVDPPWTFDGGENSYDADGRRGTATYPTMSYDEIKNIDIPSKDDCILWLWTTHKDIWMAKEILEHWGFQYKGILVWNKQKMGIGSWLRFQCEFCLLGVKGKPLWEHKDIRDIIYEERREHSRKPDCFYQMIDEKFIGLKLDYFGRTDRDGWCVYGAGKNCL